MSSYAAFLGHQPRISIAELAATIDDFTLERIIDRSIALFRSNEELTQEHLNRWGGIILLARQVSDADVEIENVPQLLSNELKSIRGKVTFSLRAIGVARPKVRELYRTCKDTLKKQGKASRYIGNERIPAATALLRDTGVTDGSHGAELVLLREVRDDNEFLWIGRTIAIQDPNAYSVRDMQKPVRDTRSGLLPPKLAQVLLNFGAWLCGGTDSGQRKADKGKQKPKSEVPVRTHPGGRSPKSYVLLPSHPSSIRPSRRSTPMLESPWNSLCSVALPPWRE